MREELQPVVYIMANRYRGTIYIGVTSAVWNRVCDHKNETFKGFTSRYGLKTLVWYEHHRDMASAIKRETQMKAWKRNWKIELIERLNPDWQDLHDQLSGGLLRRAKAGFQLAPSLRCGLAGMTT